MGCLVLGFQRAGFLTWTLTASNFNALQSHSNAGKKVIDTQCTFVLFSGMFACTEPRSATRKSRSPLLAPLPFTPSSHSNLFFSEVCALFSLTAVSQPFVYQSLRHSFHRDRGAHPSSQELCALFASCSSPLPVPKSRRPLPLRASKSRRINTCKSLSKQRTLTTFRMIDLQKTEGRGGTSFKPRTLRPLCRLLFSTSNVPTFRLSDVPTFPRSDALPTVLCFQSLPHSFIFGILQLLYLPLLRKQPGCTQTIPILELFRFFDFWTLGLFDFWTLGLFDFWTLRPFDVPTFRRADVPTFRRSPTCSDGQVSLSHLVFTSAQFSGASRQKMVWLWLPIKLSAPDTRAINKADRRRTHGTDRNATRAPLGPPLLETRPRQRRRLHLYRPDPRSCGHRSNPFPDPQPQSCRHDLAQHCPRRPRYHRLLPPHARPQNRQDQQVHRAIPDLLGHLQRLRSPCKLGCVSSSSPLRHRHARRHFQSQTRRLLVGASALALSNASRRQAALGSRTQHRHLQDLGLGRNACHCFFHLCRPDSWLRMDGFLLDGRHPPRLLAAHAVPGEQPHAPQQSGRGRLQHERVVARALPVDRLGRKLAQESSHPRRLRTPRPALVSDRHRLVFHLDARSRRPRSFRQAPPHFVIGWADRSISDFFLACTHKNST